MTVEGANVVVPQEGAAVIVAVDVLPGTLVVVYTAHVSGFLTGTSLVGCETLTVTVFGWTMRLHASLITLQTKI